MGFHQTFKALSDPTRRAILERLKNGRLTAGEIASAFDLSAATVSHHLAMLRRRSWSLTSGRANTSIMRSTPRSLTRS